MKVKNVEKKIFGDHRSLMGTSEIDSKYKYVKLARGLPTFGVHFFLVKVRIVPLVWIPNVSLFRERGHSGFGFDKCNKVSLISPVSAVERNCWPTNKEITFSGGRARVENQVHRYTLLTQALH